MGYVPNFEGITGADLTGADAATNRTYVLQNANAVIEQMQIIASNASLQANVDFTFETTTNTVTFLNKIWDDQNISFNYFTTDATSTTEYLTDTYSIAGSDLKGSNLDTGRQFNFVTNRTILYDMMQITLDNGALQRGVDFTYNTTTKTITFVNAISNSSNITINYLYTGTNYYCTTKQIVEYSGAGVETQLETLGTGDGSERSFDSENGNIIEDSYTLLYGVAGSNQLIPMVEGTDYQISLDDGRVYLFSSGVTKLGTGTLYLSYLSSPKQSNTFLTNYLSKAQAETDKMTQNYWGTATTRTEYFDGYADGYPHTDSPFGTDIEEDPEFQLRYKGIQSITSVEFLDRQGNVNSTPSSEYFRFDEEDGRFIIGPTSIPNGKRNIKIVYSAGYDSVPDLIQELCALIGGMMALVNISGGSYKDVSTYSLGRKSFSIGQVYVNIESSINQMKLRIEEISSQMGGRYTIA